MCSDPFAAIMWPMWTSARENSCFFCQKMRSDPFVAIMWPSARREFFQKIALGQCLCGHIYTSWHQAQSELQKVWKDFPTSFSQTGSVPLTCLNLQLMQYLCASTDEQSSFWQLFSQKTCMLYASIYSDWCCINILWLDSDDSGGGSDDGNGNGACK